MSLFKRPSVRYSTSPVPVTPYQAAAQVWDQRIGSARAQAQQWMLMAFCCSFLSLLMAGGLIWRASQSTVTPFVVEVDSQGQVRAVGDAITPYQPKDAEIEKQLADFIKNVRALPNDPVVVRDNWLAAYDFATSRGANALNEYANATKPFSRIAQISISIEVTSVVRASDKSFQVRWIERSYASGVLAATERWTAILTLSIQTPRNEERLRRNPLGIYVDALDWNRELTTTDSKHS